jgi:tetratricopeptide (TPR) repeat protein
LLGLRHQTITNAVRLARGVGQISKLFTIACAALLAGFSSAASAQTDIPYKEAQAAADEGESSQYWFGASSSVEWLIEEMVAADAEPELIRVQQCRLGRIYALGDSFQAGEDTFEAAFADLDQFGDTVQLSCAIDRAVFFVETGQLAKANELLRESMVSLEGLTEAPLKLRARALTEFGHLLGLQRSFDQARAVHERARAIAMRGGEQTLDLRFRNDIALIDLALRGEEPDAQLPVLEKLLEEVVAKRGEISFWTAYVLERYGGVMAAQGRLEEASKAFSLASAIKTPDPLGINLGEVRSHFIAEIIRLRLQDQRGTELSGRYSIGAGGVSDWLQVRDTLNIVHGDRIDMSAREAATSLSVSRAGFFDTALDAGWFSNRGINFIHDISREALLGMAQRPATLGASDALPDRFNPLGPMTPQDIAFIHVDALWFDAKERPAIAREITNAE